MTISNFSGSGATGGDFREAGCSVSGQTTLERLTNLLFLLRQDAYLHRVTNLEITPGSGATWCGSASDTSVRSWKATRRRSSARCRPFRPSRRTSPTSPTRREPITT